MACAANPQQHSGMHEMKHEPADAHAAHAPADAGKPGAWSYLSRDNPEPFRERRWEMIPVPGYGHMYINTGNLSPDLICAALIENPGVMVDRKTRKDCGLPEGPAIEPGMPRERMEMEHMHPGMPPMRHDENTGMAGHWAAPEEAARRQNPIHADKTSIERGGKLYKTHCAVCHGQRGRGDGPAAAGLTPRPPDLAEMAGHHPPGDLAWKIETGRGAMPAWKGILTKNEIWDLVNFIRALK